MSEIAKERLEALYSEKPLIFGHRGASADAPMNTLPAFELAAAQGADGVELDVQRTQDGKLVVMHDFTVDGTTDGTGVVTMMTLAQIKALDAGRWFDAAHAGTRVPTLDEVFSAVGQRLVINVEIKTLTLESDGIEQALADCIAAHHMESRVIVSSFNPFALQRFRALMPDIPLASLDAPEVPGEFRALMADFPYEVEHPHADMVDAALIAAARETERLVNVWTVNDLDRARVLRDLGVDGIISDTPGVMRAALG